MLNPTNMKKKQICRILKYFILSQNLKLNNRIVKNPNCDAFTFYLRKN